MPPDTQLSEREKEDKKDREKHHKHGHRERIGNYVVGAEIGRGSFATVYKGYRSKTKAPIAIKAVSRQKLTAKLLENLESEINILKVISHRSIVSLEDCFKNDTHIYLVMEFCSGSDLSIYIKNRGRLPTLDFVPRLGMGLPRETIEEGRNSEGGKVYWPHPAVGGIDERVTRCFLGQLADALKFLRSQDLIHRDIKPQNLLMQPATEYEVADGHPLGIPVLKVADFGFARILPAAAMAETLCGSPLYMAPEILRYEKYDARADLWSVGAVLYEMATGRPPFRANNHVELLRKIEKGEDRIKFPDESSKAQQAEDDKEAALSPVPVSSDIKILIRGLLKRRPNDRMGFDEFFHCGVWDGFMTASSSTEDDSLSLEVSTDPETDGMTSSATRVRELLDSQERREERIIPTHAPQPLSTDPQLNPQPAPKPVMPLIGSPKTPPDASSPVRRSEPTYYVSEMMPVTETRPRVASGITPTPEVHHSRSSSARKEAGSVEDAVPITPTTIYAPPPMARPPSRVVGDGSPLAATPPITMATSAATGKDESALEGDDSVIGREYVVVEKRTVEVNALADEVEQASKKPTALVRRPSSRISVVTRPVSAFKPSSNPSPVTQEKEKSSAVVPLSYSPPFALSTTPPFAVPSGSRLPTTPLHLSRPPSIPQNMNLNVNNFPPMTMPYDTSQHARISTSPSSLQTGALARALTNTAIRLIGTSANAATTALTRAAQAKRRPTILRSTSDIDPEQDELLRAVEDVARKAFALFELADQRLLTWHQLARPPGIGSSGTTPPYESVRRKSSSSSANSDLVALRQQEQAAGEAVVLFCKALGFIVGGTNSIQRYWETSGATSTSQDLNDMVQWLRARFNECYEKAEWAKARCAEELPFVERLVHDKAREMSRHAALAELQADYPTAEAGYEQSLWLLHTLLDEGMYESGRIKDEDRVSVEKLVVPVKMRLEALKRKMGGTITAAGDAQI